MRGNATCVHYILSLHLTIHSPSFTRENVGFTWKVKNIFTRKQGKLLSFPYCTCKIKFHYLLSGLLKIVWWSLNFISSDGLCMKPSFCLAFSAFLTLGKQNQRNCPGSLTKQSPCVALMLGHTNYMKEKESKQTVGTAEVCV